MECNSGTKIESNSLRSLNRKEIPRNTKEGLGI
jgi:hypothetical protein